MRARLITTRRGLVESLGGVAPGLVPTMGSLHDGHLALIAQSTRDNAVTVVSIFVNPTQFSDPGDLAKYPRDLERDLALAGAAGADVVFAPGVEEVYPPGFATTVEVGRMGKLWEGASRPGHFRGVATVVTILLNLARPARAYFGEKDYQQLQVIRRLHHDLALPGEIVACPTVRDADSLALSSRNARLSPLERSRALAIPRAIAAVKSSAAAGETDARGLEAASKAVLAVPGLTIDYLAIVDGTTLEPLQRLEPGARVIVAANVGGTRLIDNAAIDPLPHPGSRDRVRQEES